MRGIERGNPLVLPAPSQPLHLARAESQDLRLPLR